MAFTIANWACVSPSLNQGQETVTPFGGSSTVLNAQNLFVYASPTDTLATIAAADYFLAQYASLSVGDTIFVNGTDGSNMYIVTASSSTSVTVSSFTVSGSVGTSNIQNNAVTYAKMQQASTVSLLGNPTGGTANVSEITLGTGLEFNSTTIRVPITQLNYAVVSVSAAEFKGAYASPKLLVAAPGANRMLVHERTQLLMTYGTAAYAGGGLMAIQYDSTANGAGVIASSQQAAVGFQATASTAFPFTAGEASGSFTNCVNKGLYLSNITGAFTTGDSAFVAHVWYQNIPTV